eukprot:scaffold1318_cov362-Pavlova_lutheri.AAC.16
MGSFPARPSDRSLPCPRCVCVRSEGRQHAPRVDPGGGSGGSIRTQRRGGWQGHNLGRGRGRGGVPWTTPRVRWRRG